MRRTDAIEELIPWLYLKGISTSDFSEALQAIVGERAKGLSANVVVRLKAQWADEYDEWCKRDLSDKHYVYVWADGIHVKVRLEDDANKKQCILVLMGATADGKKELLAVLDGYRESEQSWSELLLSLKQRGLTTAPKIAVGDGALGFWAALRKVFPQTREQRCWAHKTANVLNKMPKSVQPKAKSALHEIWQAETKANAEQAFEEFFEKYDAKYQSACDCLRKDQEQLLAFYDFPAEHWGHMRTTNPIESTFATIRLRHRKTKGNGTRRASLAMMFKLAQSASRWNFERPHFQFGVSPQNVSRALRILQTLVAAWEARGYTVDISRGHRHGGKDQPVFQIMDQHYTVSFWEPSKRVRDESKASLKPRYSWERDYVYKPTGKLELHVNRDSCWSSAVIRDTAKLRLEDRLNEFVCQIYRLVDQAIVKAEQDRIKAIEKAKRKELAIEAEIVRRSDAVRTKQLVQLTQQWEWARKLEVFIAVVREECNQRPDETDVDTEAWLAWAEHYVATVDPLRHDGELQKYTLSKADADELHRQCEADWCEWSERFRTR